MENRLPGTEDERDQAHLVLTPLVLFNGRCAPEDRALITEAAAEIAEALPAPPRLKLLGRPWVCSCHRIDGKAYFMAHWIRSPRVLTARSAPELAEKMRRLAGPPGR